jgi:hypothetical protein
MLPAGLTLMVLTHISLVASEPATGFGTVRGALVDHEGKPVFNAEIRVWTRFPPTEYRPDEALRFASLVHPYGRSGFEVPSVWAGKCTLVARFESPSAQNFIVREFELTDGGTADLGEIGPSGKDHGFRLAILRESDGKQGGLESPTATEVSPGVVKFEMSSLDPVVDAFMHCSFSMPAEKVVTIRGLDSLNGPFEVEAQVREDRLLSESYRAVSGLWPRITLRKEAEATVSLDLVIAPARPVDLEFTMTSDLSPRDVESLECAVVDRAGNVRRVVDAYDGKWKRRKRVQLAPGTYDLYAAATTWNCRWDDPSGAVAYQQMSVPNAARETSIQVTLKRGVTITGRLTGSAKAADASFSGLIRGESGGRTDDSHFMPLRVRPHDGEFTLRNLPPGAEISFGRRDTKPERWKTVRVPSEGGSIGDIVFE